MKKFVEFVEGYFTYTVADKETAVISKYTGNETIVVIPFTLGGYPVVGIGEWAFNNNRTLEYVFIPDQICQIGRRAFRRCIALKSVRLPASLITFYLSSFSCCDSLEELVLPTGVNTVVLDDMGDDRKIYIPPTVSKFVKTDGGDGTGYEYHVTNASRSKMSRLVFVHEYIKNYRYNGPITEPRTRYEDLPWWKKITPVMFVISFIFEERLQLVDISDEEMNVFDIPDKERYLADISKIRSATEKQGGGHN